MLPAVFGAMDYEQSRCVPSIGGMLGNQMCGEVKVEKVGAKRHGKGETRNLGGLRADETLI